MKSRQERLWEIAKPYIRIERQQIRQIKREAARNLHPQGEEAGKDEAVGVSASTVRLMRRGKDMVLAIVLSFLLVTGMIGIGVLFGRVLCKIDGEEESGEAWPEEFDGQLFPSVQKPPGDPGGAAMSR